MPDLPYIGLENVAPHTMKLLGTQSTRNFKSIAESFSPGDVLYGRLRPYLNKVYSPTFYGLCSAEFIPFRKTPMIETKYLQYFLNSWEFVQFASRINAGDRPRVDFKQIENYPFPLAPIPDQQRIVAKIEELFSQLDVAEAALKRAMANLKRYQQSVLQAAVTGELTREWRAAHAGEIEPAGVLLERIRDERRAKWEAEMRAKGKDPAREKYVEPQGPDASRLPKLPEGWVWVNLSGITSQIGDVDHKMPKAASSDIPYISTRDFIDTGEIDYENAKKISMVDYSSLSRKIFPTKGDILLSRYGTVGEVRIVKTEKPFQASYSIAIIKPIQNNLSINYLASVLQSKVCQDQIKRYTRATAQPDLGLAHIKILMIPLPPLKEQKQITLEIDRQESIIQQIEMVNSQSLLNITGLRQKILEFAFKGDL